MTTYTPAPLRRLERCRGFGGWSRAELIQLFRLIDAAPEAEQAEYRERVRQTIARTRRCPDLLPCLLKMPRVTWISQALKTFGEDAFQRLEATPGSFTQPTDLLHYHDRTYREDYIGAMELLAPLVLDPLALLFRFISEARLWKDGPMLSRMIKAAHIRQEQIFEALNDLRPWKRDIAKILDLGTDAFDACHDPQGLKSRDVLLRALRCKEPHPLAAAVARGDDLTYLRDLMSDPVQDLTPWIPRLRTELSSRHGRLKLHERLVRIGGTREIFSTSAPKIISALTGDPLGSPLRGHQTVS